MAKVRIGETVVRIGDDGYRPSPEEIEEVASQIGLTQSAPQESQTPNVALSGPVGAAVNFGAEKFAKPIMQTPASAIRSHLQGTGYAHGAVNPEQIPTFTEQATAAANPRGEKLSLGGVMTAPRSVGASLVGGAADMATNPGELLMMALAGFPKTKAAGAVKEQLRYKPDVKKLTDKGHKLTTEILQPSKLELQKNLSQGRQHPAVEQAFKVIRKSKDYGQLKNNMDDVITDLFTKRQKIYEGNNFQVGDEYLDELKSLIVKSKKFGQFNDAEIRQMEDVLEAEIKRLGMDAPKVKAGPTNVMNPAKPQKNIKYMDRISAQKRKEELQDMTQSLMETRENGESVITQPARKKALDALRSGLRRVVNANDPEVEAINATYEGLKDAQWLSSGQEALAQKRFEGGLMQRVLDMVSNRNPAGYATRQATERNRSLGKATEEIQRLSELLRL